MKKILALVLAMVMMLALVACGGGAEEAAAPAEAPAAAPAEAPAAAPDAAAPVAEAPAAAPTGDLEGYKAYCTAFANAGAPTEEEKANAAAAIAACTTAEEVEACTYLSPMFSGEMILTFDAWVEAGCPEADTSAMVAGDPSASGEASAEPAA